MGGCLAEGIDLDLPVFLAQAAITLRTHLAAGFVVTPLLNFPQLLQVEATMRDTAEMTLLVPHARQVIVSVLCAQVFLLCAQVSVSPFLRFV